MSWCLVGSEMCIRDRGKTGRIEFFCSNLLDYARAND
jgi:hypothetical protein